MSYRQFEIWHQCNGYRIAVFVIELNPTEIIRRKAMNEEPKYWDRGGDPNRPWPRAQKEPLIWRRWNIGEAYTKGGFKRMGSAWARMDSAWGVAELFKTAEALRDILNGQAANGKPFNPPPDFGRKFKHGTKTDRPKKKDDRRPKRADNGARVLGTAGLPAEAGRERPDPVDGD